MVWTPAAVRARLGHVVLDAPDVPTLYFRRTVGHLAAVGVRVLHLFNPLDEAIEVSRLRRNADKPYPGQAAIVTARGVEAVDCALCVASHGVHHDYGRVDGFCMMDQVGKPRSAWLSM